MAILPTNPREILPELDIEYQRLAQEHSQYEEELQNLTKSSYLNSEDLLQQIKLKKLKLRVKDQMEQILWRRAHGQPDS
ncbi:MAG TPA: DUF465 domain-containing protein [Candidatus Dormibacteraeota bacterium]|nr:DUF465 domain-containing protein [Candidatus Dormibacteraeota bacterium]